MTAAGSAPAGAPAAVSIQGRMVQVVVIVNDVQYRPIPRVRAMIEQLLKDQDAIAHILTGKIIFHLGEKTVTPHYEMSGETITVSKVS